MVQGKGYQPEHILLTPECGEKRTAETSRIAFAADRTTATVKTQCIARGTDSEKSELAVPQKIIIRKDGIEVEMPPDISEELLLTLLRGLKEC